MDLSRAHRYFTGSESKIHRSSLRIFLRSERQNRLLFLRLVPIPGTIRRAFARTRILDSRSVSPASNGFRGRFPIDSEPRIKSARLDGVHSDRAILLHGVHECEHGESMGTL